MLGKENRGNQQGSTDKSELQIKKKDENKLTKRRIKTHSHTDRDRIE